MISHASWVQVLAAVLVIGAAIPARAELDLRNASVEQFENGFTLILLPDRRFPVASVQMLYRVGARNEVNGKTGLAHFLEHMAFRDSDNFPDTDLVSSIYAVGGEWHGYTWTDQTTYYSTVPKDDLDLLLRIEADRMTRLKLSAEDMRAERGAVLAEMHMYENSPTSMLIDAVNYTSFLAHPYRNNTIGWESDIEHLQHGDVVEFYKQHYQPANAVLAIVGDFEPDAVRERAMTLFGSVRSSEATALPHTVEPPQVGLRRVTLQADTDIRQFMIAYRAPAVGNADFAAFLVMQEILGAGSGVSFLQNDWGTPVADDSVLAGAADSMTTWFPPSEQDYVFIVGGVAPAADDEATLEQRVESRIASLREQPPTNAELQAAIQAVQDELVFDVQTTEDAAHQLAFFSGLNALPVLLGLPESVAAVSATDVQRVAIHYLAPQRRSVAWYVPFEEAEPPVVATTNAAPARQIERPPGDFGSEQVKPAIATRLSGGIPVILQHSDLSSTVQLQIVLPGNQLEGAVANSPIAGYSSIAYAVRPQRLAQQIQQAVADLAEVRPLSHGAAPKSSDPATRMEQEFAELMQVDGNTHAVGALPSLITVVGDIDMDAALEQLEQAFGAVKSADASKSRAKPFSNETVSVSLGKPVAQAQLGYFVAAPGPADPRSDAWRLLLYVLSHDYEGRLGKSAISDAGLAYYIGSEYRSDGINAWISLSAGVDANNIEALRELLHSELARLRREPPSNAEIAAAKSHRLGRAVSSAQSNAELATAARQGVALVR